MGLGAEVTRAGICCPPVSVCNALCVRVCVCTCNSIDIPQAESLCYNCLLKSNSSEVFSIISCDDTLATGADRQALFQCVEG